ncbi:MAG: type 1 glutamine amidotransferase domain-containing protein [Pseudomonadota bacterium]
MNQALNGKRVAILAADGFEESELSVPRASLQKNGVEVHVVTPQGTGIRAWAETDWGDTYEADAALADVNESDYHALVLPGGLFNPDTLRLNKDALAFVKAFFQAGKPVAAICHAPWILINAGVVKGRRMTSVASVAQDLRNAGVDWVDEPVVVDSGLVTSRTPKDLDAFNAKVLEELQEGRHVGQHA